MTTQEVNRFKLLQAVIDGDLKPGRAAERLGLTDRQVRRLVERVRQEGPAGAVSKRYGRASNNRAPAELTPLGLDIIRERYADFGPTLACEKLREVHGLVLSKETVRKLMSEAGLWTPRRLRSVAILPAEESPSLCRRAELAIRATRPVDVTKKLSAASCS